jgi:hypothetical protein
VTRKVSPWLTCPTAFAGLVADKSSAKMAGVRMKAEATLVLVPPAGMVSRLHAGGQATSDHPGARCGTPPFDRAGFSGLGTVRHHGPGCNLLAPWAPHTMKPAEPLAEDSTTSQPTITGYSGGVSPLLGPILSVCEHLFGQLERFYHRSQGITGEKPFEPGPGWVPEGQNLALSGKIIPLGGIEMVRSAGSSKGFITRAAKTSMKNLSILAQGFSSIVQNGATG